jgi:hypothetical protein
METRAFNTFDFSQVTQLPTLSGESDNPRVHFRPDGSTFSIFKTDSASLAIFSEEHIINHMSWNFAFKVAEIGSVIVVKGELQIFEDIVLLVYLVKTNGKWKYVEKNFVKSADFKAEI